MEQINEDPKGNWSRLEQKIDQKTVHGEVLMYDYNKGNMKCED